MKKIQVTFTVDITNEEQMNALTNLLDFIKENVNDDAPVTTEPNIFEKKLAANIPDTKKKAAVKTDIKIDELRSIVREKSADKELRGKIVKKLAELGVKATSELQEEQFEKFKEFLDGI